MNYFPTVLRFCFPGVLIIILGFTTNPSFVTAKVLPPELTEPVNGEKVCPELTEPLNGENFGKCKDATRSNICFFKCKKDYTMEGKSYLTCRPDSSWDADKPQCKKKCEKLENPEHGKWNCNVSKVNDMYCICLCDANYKADGPVNKHCGNGTWNTNDVTTCKNDVPDGKPHDCAAIKKKDADATTKMYEIWPKKMTKAIQVQCDMTTDGGGWTIFQIRGDFSEKENFYRDWVDYVNGFGGRKKDHEYWIGLDAIYAISNYEPQSLRVDMGDFDGQRRYAKYTTFSIGSGDEYKLAIGGYSGDAGDSLWVHNTMRFSTKDHGNTYCPDLYKGGWWYNFCHHSNLNGLYLRGTTTTFADGINWVTFRGWYYSLKSTEMKMRRRAY